MSILVVNSGSSSVKFQLLDMEGGERLIKGVTDRIGLHEPFGQEGRLTAATARRAMPPAAA